MTGERGRCLAPHVGRAQVGGIYKQLQRLGITECLNGAVGRHASTAAAKPRNGM